MLGERRSHERRIQTIEQRYRRSLLRLMIVVIFFCTISGVANGVIAEARSTQGQTLIQLCKMLGR